VHNTSRPFCLAVQNLEPSSAFCRAEWFALPGTFLKIQWGLIPFSENFKKAFPGGILINMQNADAKTAAQHQTMIVLWAALLISQFLFAAMIFIIKPALFAFKPSASPLGDTSPIVILFALAAITAVGVSFFLRRKNVEKGIALQKVEFVQTGLILGCALCEASTLLGLLLAFAFNYRYFFLWIALGILGTILHFPRRHDIEAANFKRL
jgi:hypothetical protein